MCTLLLKSKTCSAICMDIVFSKIQKKKYRAPDWQTERKQTNCTYPDTCSGSCSAFDYHHQRLRFVHQWNWIDTGARAVTGLAGQTSGRCLANPWWCRFFLTPFGHMQILYRCNLSRMRWFLNRCWKNTRAVHAQFDVAAKAIPARHPSVTRLPTASNTSCCFESAPRTWKYSKPHILNSK